MSGELYALDYRGWRIVVRRNETAFVYRKPGGGLVASSPTEEGARHIVDLFCDAELRNDPVDRI